MPHQIDERMARLQRVAYGADASDEERAAAQAELAALRERAADADGGAAGGARPAASGDDRVATASATPSAPPSDAGNEQARPRRRVGTRAVAASVAFGLLVGAGVGWALGSATEPSVGDDADLRVERTQAWQVFDRRIGEGDLVRYPPPTEPVVLDGASHRLLLTRSDGVRLVAARTADGQNACLVLVLPVGRPGIACTEAGLFPADGLRAEVAARAVGEYLAVWRPDGSVTVNAAAFPSG